MSGLVFMPFPLFFSLHVVVENRNGMREPSCGNERALTQALDLRSTFPGVSHFAVLCLQLSQCSLLEFVIVFIIG